ncbi:hypothetical protein ACFQGA_16305 [Marinobacter koreensis]|uniref:Rap1a immunity protein domain-containing protein n=1 Tax=Marinobacter koreensis TaxID=335974 RepID=A0ABW0RM47_9GAMM|nr:hypothetical protein [Marinobacter koreensis]MCK7549251.1 hypothetical protein [Marinobacter koreensis]
MKTTLKVLAACFVILLSSSTHALTVADYQRLNEAQVRDSSGKVNLLMKAYFQAIFESVLTIAMASESSRELDLGPYGKACFPSLNALSPDVIKNSLESQIFQMKDTPKADKFDVLMASSLAIWGLPEVFPCR